MSEFPHEEAVPPSAVPTGELAPARAAPRQTAALKIIAVTNIKGGVGKTTTAVNLSYLCAANGRSTLLWDLDPQGAATYILRGEPLDRVSPKKLLAGKRQLPELILPTQYPGLDLLPADFSYRNFDVHLSGRKRPTERLLKMSRPLRDLYSVLFLDCAPGISLLSENVLRAADAIIVPLLPTPLSLRMLAQLRHFITGEGWTVSAARRSPHSRAPVRRRRSTPRFGRRSGRAWGNRRRRKPP